MVVAAEKSGADHRTYPSTCIRVVNAFGKIATPGSHKTREKANQIHTDSTLRIPSLDFFSKIRPTYFNTGCCCYSDGDITGIEISEKCIKLIKWKKQDGKSVRIELENISFEQLIDQLSE